MLPRIFRLPILKTCSAFLLLVATSDAVLAIPSPELIVSSLSSLSHLWAIAGALAGGGAVALGARARGAKIADQRMRRWLIAALSVAGVALALDVAQFAKAQTERAERLEATLARPAPKRADGQSLDPNLFELPYRRQIESAMGLSTRQTASLMADIEAGRRTDVIALDVRETVETESGGITGARAIRFPDLDASGIDFAGKTALLFCHNGHRSAETCTRLKARGIECRFMVGGFEKWLVDGYALRGSKARKLSDLRLLAAYPNQSTLLDTADVKRLLADQRAIFVDVRYPGEFEATRLPGAINLPLRAIPSEELARRMDALPQGPIIAPCYDRRSCFFADVLGVELSRRGRVMLGRYTVPWEYFERPPPAPHIQAWLLEANQTTFQRLSQLLADGLEAAASQVGIAGAIVALAMISRLLVWPLAAKADRDQHVSRAIAPQVAALKSRLQADPQRLARALRTLMRRHGLTPLRNLLALAFLPVLALSIEAVAQVALRRKGQPLGHLGWILDLNAPDPLTVLPVVFSALIALYLHLTLAEGMRSRLVIWVIGFPVLTAFVATTPALTSFYLVVSAILLLTQRWVARWRWDAARETVRHAMRRMQVALAQVRLANQHLVPLLDVARASRCGSKAARLAVLAEMGLPVPRGVVLTNDALSGPTWSSPADRARTLNLIWRHCSAGRLAVRSSAAVEDGPDQSFAGVFQTVLDVEREGLERAINRVVQSFSASSVGAYADNNGCHNVLVQPMVRARFAGVVFTQDPAIPGCGLIEWVVGHGDGLVSGRTSPHLARIGRLTGTVVGDEALPFDLAVLWRDAMRIEARFARPQDIEWAYDGRRFVFLQTRDIAPDTDGPAAVVNAEWKRLGEIAGAGPAGPVLVSDAVAEVLPRPTPASLSLLNAFWAGGGSMDCAARSLGFHAPDFDGDDLDAPTLYVTAFGSLYANRRERDKRALRSSAMAARALWANAHALEKHVRMVVLPKIMADAARADAIDPARLTTPALMALFNDARHQYVHETHVQIDTINIVAQSLMDEARAALIQCGEDPAPVLALAPRTRLRRQLLAVMALEPAQQTARLCGLLGHRAVLDYELAMPRYGENEVALAAAARTLAGLAQASQTPRTLLADHHDGQKLPKDVKRLVNRALAFVTLKEDAKHESLRELAILRRLLLEIDRRFAFEGTIFELSLDEAGALTGDTRGGLFAMALQRQATVSVLRAVVLSNEALTRRDIEVGSSVQAAAVTSHARTTGRVIVSTRVSGHDAVEGRAICVARDLCESGAPIPGFEPGDIIVARSMHPAWLPHLMTCGGVVVETGGWLSHMSILARERGLAMSVGARGLDRIETGMRLRLECDGAVVRLG